MDFVLIISYVGIKITLKADNLFAIFDNEFEAMQAHFLGFANIS
jgi:hypothetical protein